MDNNPNWRVDNGTGNYTTTQCTGVNSGKLDNTGDYFEVWFTGSPNQLTYTLKGQGYTSGTFTVEEFYGGSYHIIVTYSNSTDMSGSCTANNYTLNSGTSKVKFNFVTKGVGNVCLDEVTITPANAISPWITGVLINSCNGSCQEGDNEIIFLNSEDYNIPVSPANIVAKYESVNPATITYTDSYISNAGFITSLNASAGCGTLFYDAVTIGIIPSHSSFMIIRNTACYPYNLSSFCGFGPVYVLFSTDVSWISGGNFSNGAASGVKRYFRSDFSSIGGNIIDYEPNLLILQGDGDAVTFSPAGGSATRYFNNGCNPDNDVLPITLLSFTGESHIDYNLLKWSTDTETNNNYFTIESTINGKDFEEVGRVQGAGSSTSIKTYLLKDFKPHSGTTYYRLKQTDYDGKNKSSDIISVTRPNQNLRLLKITNLLGQDVDQNYDGIKIYYFSDGSVIKKYKIK